MGGFPITCGHKVPHSPPGFDAPDLPGAIPRAWTFQSYRIWLTVRPSIPHRSNVGGEYRNINLSSIAYACRPQLRARLTLGGFTFPRKPKAFGEVRFSLPLSLLVPAFSLPFGRGLLTVTLQPDGTLPYRIPLARDTHGFGSSLVPIIVGAEMHRLVSCYAIFK